MYACWDFNHLLKWSKISTTQWNLLQCSQVRRYYSWTMTFFLRIFIWKHSLISHTTEYIVYAGKSKCNGKTYFDLQSSFPVARCEWFLYASSALNLGVQEAYHQMNSESHVGKSEMFYPRFSSNLHSSASTEWHAKQKVW